MKVCLALVVVFLGLSTLLVDSQSTPPPDQRTLPAPRGYVCYQANAPVTIDGQLNEAAWQRVPWSETFVDIEGDRRPKPTHPTRMKMLWDDQHLYLAAQITEPHVWGTLTQHDSVIFQDNDFEVFLDPDGDNHLYAELELNALNTTWDLLLSMPYKDGGRALDAWEITGLKTAVHVQGTLNNPGDKDEGWTVEIAWPWRSLRELTAVPVPPREGDRWRINFSRVEWDHEIVEGKYRKIPKRPEHNWIWSPQGVVDMHRPERWGYLQFSKAAPGSVRYQADADQAVRDQLHQVYYAQREYRQKQGRWATSLKELGLGELSDGIRLEHAGKLFEASGPCADQSKTRWHIRQDGRFWRE